MFNSGVQKCGATVLEADTPPASGPLFSVVIPVYNQSRFIEKTVESVMLQSHSDWEMILVDDGSTDDTMRSLQELAKKDVRIQVYSKRNGGVASARNYGIARSNGRWICFLDSDDLWSKGKLRRIYEEIETKWGELYVICHDESLVNESDAVIGMNRYGMRKGYHGDLHEYLLFHRNCLSPSATCVRRTVFRDAGIFNESEYVDSVEDYDLWMRIAKRYEVVFIHEVLGSYRRTSQGLSSDFRKHFRNRIFVRIHHLEQFSKSRRFGRFQFFLQSRWSLTRDLVSMALLYVTKNKMQCASSFVAESVLLWLRPLRKTFGYDAIKTEIEEKLSTASTSNMS